MLFLAGDTKLAARIDAEQAELEERRLANR